MKVILLFIPCLLLSCSGTDVIESDNVMFEDTKASISSYPYLKSEIKDLLAKNISFDNEFFSESWISSIKTTKSFDKNLIVEVKEHQPVASLGRGKFFTQDGKIIFPKDRNKQLDLISIIGDDLKIPNLLNQASSLQTVLNSTGYVLTSFADEGSGILEATDNNGVKYRFNEENFRVQLERLEEFILFELNSGSNDHIRYIDLRYKNAIAVGREKMEKSI
tara:strand:+ start:2111 stop:2770 length:660 start_codon:yes stop_codon:yes gene_type:complete